MEKEAQGQPVPDKADLPGEGKIGRVLGSGERAGELWQVEVTWSPLVQAEQPTRDGEDGR